MRTVPRRSSIALLAAVAAALAALAGPAVASAEVGQIIVKYAAGADAQERSEARADADVVRDEALALPRTELVTPEAGTSVRAAAADLERSADVEYAEPDLPRHALDLYPDEAQVDPPQLLRALVASVARAGIVVRSGATVSSLDPNVRGAMRKRDLLERALGIAVVVRAA